MKKSAATDESGPADTAPASSVRLPQTTATSVSDVPFEPRRILIVVTRQIGDVLLTTPLLQAASERWPASSIDVLGSAGTLGMLAGRTDVAQRIEIGSLRLRPMLALAATIWRRYDLALVADASDRAHLLGFAAARVRSGVVPERRTHAWWKRLLLRHAVVVGGDRGATHVTVEKLALLQPWCRVEALRSTPSPPPPTPLPDDIAALLGEAPIVVHAPSMWRYKQWPIESFRVVIEGLLGEGRQVVLTGDTTAGDRAKVDALLRLSPPPGLVDACGRLDFGQLATLLGRAALYIGPDTSVTHLAAAVGVPVIALFGPTNPIRWAPIGRTVLDGALEPALERHGTAPQRRGNVVLIQGPGGCVPCGRAGCDDHRQSASACLENIAPEQVLVEAHRVLERGPRQ